MSSTFSDMLSSIPPTLSETVLNCRSNSSMTASVRGGSLNVWPWSRPSLTAAMSFLIDSDGVNRSSFKATFSAMAPEPNQVALTIGYCTIVTPVRVKRPKELQKPRALNPGEGFCYDALAVGIIGTAPVGTGMVDV